MKKIYLLLLCAILALPMMADDDGVVVTFWFDAPKSAVNKNVDGLKLGIPLGVGKADVDGAELSLFYSQARRMRGFQYAWIGLNNSERLTGAQLAFLNFIGTEAVKTGVQVGFYNQSKKDGIQIGFVNNGQNNATFQFGLININQNGLFPVMIFVNFAKDFFQ